MKDHTVRGCVDANREQGQSRRRNEFAECVWRALGARNRCCMRARRRRGIRRIRCRRFACPTRTTSHGAEIVPAAILPPPQGYIPPRLSPARRKTSAGNGYFSHPSVARALEEDSSTQRNLETGVGKAPCLRVTPIARGDLRRSALGCCGAAGNWTACSVTTRR